ncbi:MAG: transcription antitermination factor NusB [Bacteroidales bacterium]|jgi:N utilization substance protein B|nr:transcription antitermination factor NusB [Bacteroidales bacterium]
MLSRRHLRIKVLQALYAYFQNGDAKLSNGEKQLIASVNKIHELFIHQLSFLIEIRDFAHNRIEDSKKKFFPTEEDLDPNMKFVNNRVLKQIEENREFRRLHDKLKINWSEEDSAVRKAFLAMRDSGFYQKYMSGSENSYEGDSELLLRIVKKILAEFELLEYHYESRSVFWAFDSYHTTNLMVIKYLKSLKPGDNSEKPLPEMIDNGEGHEDRQFMIDLFRKTILHSDEYAELIDEKARNWELERIALMDIILIKMALAELLEFPSIPVKVTLNEYIDISKYYSSAKSKVFINGILDKLIVDLKEKKMIKKTGRGLLEF